MIYPNSSMLLFVRDHELAIAHARAYNDYIHEVFGAYGDRLVPVAMIPLTDVDDAVAEIERAASLGLRAINVPTQPPVSYATDTYDRVWAAAQALGMTVTFHVGTGFESSDDPNRTNFQAAFDSLATNAMTPSAVEPHALRLLQQAEASLAAQRVVISLVGGGVLERFPALHFVATEFNAHWLASAMAAMDKACVVGIGQDDEGEAGLYFHDRSADYPPASIRRFAMNASWPYPLRPSDYVRRQVHAPLLDDPAAVAMRHLTGVEALLWGADYPHAEGTWPRSKEAIDAQFAGVD